MLKALMSHNDLYCYGSIFIYPFKPKIMQKSDKIKLAAVSITALTMISTVIYFVITIGTNDYLTLI